MIRNCTIADAIAIAEIYNYYIQNTIITFEEELVNSPEIIQRMEKIHANGLPYLVYEEDGVIIGYAYAGEFRSRCAYRHTLESSLYLRHGCGGRGIGEQLYRELIERLKNTGCHSLIGVVAAPNPASSKLHTRLGFNYSGTLRDAGYKFDRWIDTEYWQLMLA